MRSRNAVALWALVVGYAAAIFVLSSFPSPAAVEEPAALVGDKALHLLEYGILAAFLAFALSTHASSHVRSRAALLALSGAALYAASDELHQTLVPSRRGDVLDFAADVAGAAIAVGIYRLWISRFPRTAAVSDISPR